MKIRNLEELQSELNADRAWRKKEIADFYILCHSNNNPACMVRACFVMICAHFEGAIRYASNAYIAFISGQNIKGTDLRIEISAIAVRKKKHHLFNHTGAKKVKVSSVLEILKVYDDLLDRTFFIKMSDDDFFPEIDDTDPAIPTEGNPTPEVLSEIAKILGLDYDALFRLRENFINSELLNPRNSVAHGEKRPITNKELDEAKNFVINIIDEYSSAIMEAAINNTHMRNNATV